MSTADGFEFGAEHVALVFRKLICLRTIAQVVHRNAAAEIDVFERVARLAMNRDQVFPHALECFGKWLDVGRLRADVNVNAADMDQIRILQDRDETPPALQTKRCQTSKSAARFANRDASACRSPAQAAA